MQASISSGCRNDTAVHGGWDTHSSALGLQTKQFLGEIVKSPGETNKTSSFWEKIS
jgi:hypothetical protein